MIDHKKAISTSLIRLLLFIIAIMYSSLWAQDLLSKMNTASSSAMPISVSVTGKVKSPGTYYLTNMNRVTDAIYKANLITITQTEPVKNQINEQKREDQDQTDKTIQTETALISFEQDSSLRNVILRRHGKDIILDVLHFIRNGDVEQNPYLEDGDVIIMLPVKMQVAIEGAVFQPGLYEIRVHETLGDVMDLTQGLKPEADFDRGFIHRYLEDGKSVATIAIPRADLADLKPGKGIELQDGDRIELGARSDFHPDRSVKVTGEVKFPGTYAIQDSISLLALLQRCGGPTPKADLRNTQAFNNIRVETHDPAYSFLELQKFAVSNKADEDYLRMRIRQPVGLIANNVEELWKTQDKTHDIYLHKNDTVHIPEISRTVTLLGQVETPGVYDWRPDMTWSMYIQNAGGYSWHADLGKIRIIRAYSGNWIKPDKYTRLNAGDMIFIPAKADRTNWDVFKETLLITSQIVTILFAVKSLTN